MLIINDSQVSRMLLTTTILDLIVFKGYYVTKEVGVELLNTEFIKEFLDHFTINVLGKLTRSRSNKDPSNIGDLFIC